jgi:deferrochelatase/peroxidase EfeB
VSETEPTKKQPDSASSTDKTPAETPGVSRRFVLGAAGIGTVAAGVSAAAGFLAGRAAGEAEPTTTYGYFGEHQSGILTAQQNHLHFASYDLTTDSRDDVVALLRTWTAAAATLMAGQDLGRGVAGGSYLAAPDDTGEAHDLPPSGLTITFGFGRTLFEREGSDRFGLRARMPEQLVDLPHFPGDELEAQRVGGDLCIQACADDPQVASHAIRNLTRIAIGTAAIRWDQQGFGRTSSTTRAQQTPRNLMGFKDGTNNLRAEDTTSLQREVWSSASDKPEWMTGGSYLVARRILILTHLWDQTPLGEQERMIGRAKGSGAPLSGGEEFTAPDFDRRGDAGLPLISHDSHVALAHPSRTGHLLLRRSYNFTDGVDADGHFSAGLFFLAFMRDAREQFIPLQTTMSRTDGMTVNFLRSTGSALFAVPPGLAAGSALDATSGDFIGSGAFA